MCAFMHYHTGICIDTYFMCIDTYNTCVAIYLILNPFVQPKIPSDLENIIPHFKYVS